MAAAAAAAGTAGAVGAAGAAHRLQVQRADRRRRRLSDRFDLSTDLQAVRGRPSHCSVDLHGRAICGSSKAVSSRDKLGGVRRLPGGGPAAAERAVTADLGSAVQ